MFEIPENLAELSIEQLTELATGGRAALSELYAVEVPTPAQATEAEALAAGIATVETEQAERAAAVTRMASLRESFAAEKAVEPEPVVEPEKPAEPEAPAEEEAPVEEAPAEEVQRPADEATPPSQEAAVVTAPLNTAALDGQRPAVVPTNRTRTIFAAADVPGVGTGAPMTVDQLAESFLDKMTSFPAPSGTSEVFGTDLRTFGHAKIARDIPEDLVLTDGMSGEAIETVLNRAIDQTRLPQQSLVAAGGWCSPSETSYNLADDGSTTEGILSFPEVAMGRGGIRRTLGPDWSDIYGLTNFFKMTEAQAIAGSFTKPCYTVTCPTFADFRLDAYGYCFQIPLLTEAAYPEVIKRYLSGSMIAYAHKMNADKITRLLALLPAAEVATGIGSVATSLFGAIQLLVDRERDKRRWSMRQAVEVVLPFWVKGALKSDIRLRTGTPFGEITDGQIQAAFASINANPQWVYDWQDLGSSVLAYPTTFDIAIYKAGTFVVGTTKVISLSSVYDAASLAANIYTGAFFEEGMTMVRMGFGGIRVTVPLCIAGLTGANNVACS